VGDHRAGRGSRDGDVVSAPQLTEWFGPSINPVLPGVYEVDPDESGPWYSYWDGKEWGFMIQDTPDAAVRTYQRISNWRHDSMVAWRGLAQKPAEYEDALKYVAAA
jgi:hypothetical protein